MQTEKTIKAMQNNKRDWTMREIISVTTHLGFTYHNHRSSHYIFKHEQLTEHLSIPDHPDIHPDYITKLLRLIKKVKDLTVIV